MTALLTGNTRPARSSARRYLGNPVYVPFGRDMHKDHFPIGWPLPGPANSIAPAGSRSPSANRTRTGQAGAAPPKPGRYFGARRRGSPDGPDSCFLIDLTSSTPTSAVSAPANRRSEAVRSIRVTTVSNSFSKEPSGIDMLA
jgi:hypothetical protein